jgi:hypothetical protein
MKDMNHLGIDIVGKRKCRAVLKDDKGRILDEIPFWNWERININHRLYDHMALGDLAFEETGKFTGIRALPDGKVEATYQGTGKLFDVDYSSIYTGVATPHGGTLIAEFNGICTTKDGDTVGVWAHGRGRPTGSGLKASWRGGVI